MFTHLSLINLNFSVNMEGKSKLENIYCKGEMSKRALNLLLKQNDSHSSVAVWDGFAERRYSLFKRSKLRLDRSYRKYNRGTASTDKSLPPFPHATPEGGTG